MPSFDVELVGGPDQAQEDPGEVQREEPDLRGPQTSSELCHWKAFEPFSV